MKTRIESSGTGISRWLLAVLLIASAPALLLAKGPPGGGGKVSVTLATPSDAFQGEELEVLIDGSGFDDGSQATWYVTGTTDSSQVVVESTEYLPATGQLKARIKVNGNANVNDYDIEVQNSSGRRGKGTTLFKVKATVDDPCATSVETEPAIVFLTEREKSGPKNDYVYTSDLRITTSDGCMTTTLIEDAEQRLPDTRRNEGKELYIENVDFLRLVISGNRGVVSWSDPFRTPSVLEYFEFHFDEQGAISMAPELDSYASSAGYNISAQDIRILENGDLLAVVIEHGQSLRRVVVVNLSTGHEQVISSGNCHYLGTDGLCYTAVGPQIHWDPTGSAFYVRYLHDSEAGYKPLFFRGRSNQIGGWLTPELIITDFGGFEGGVSIDGYINYEFRNEPISNPTQPLFRGILDLNLCTPTPCNRDDGLTFGDGLAGKWTADDTILFWRDGSLLEYIDPFNSQETRTIMTNVHPGEFDPDI